jgi:hypothetical protein
MRNHRSRIIKWSAIALISLVIVIFSLNIVASQYARHRVEGTLNTLGISLGSLTINFFLLKITLSNIQSTHAGDSLSTKIRLNTIVLEKVGLYQLLRHKKLSIEEIVIEGGNLRLNVNQIVKDTTRSNEPSALKSVTIGRISLKNLATELLDSGASYSAELNLTLRKIQSSNPSDLANPESYTFEDIDGDIAQISINHSNGLYQTKVSGIHASREDKTLVIDSVFLIPRHSKFRFTKVAEKQIDRVNAFIRKIEVHGIRFDSFNDSTFTATNIEIMDAEVFSFRDKRMPFKEKKNKRLPMEALRNIRLGIEVDTLRITNSKITYEEFPSEGFESGKVVFANLTATLLNLSNRYYYNKPKFATLSASAKLMNKGLLKASFLLPIREDLQYHAEGSLTGMSLFSLNPTLENLAFIRIESGKLNSMHFDFNYTDRVSNGKLTINYEDLKIAGLKKEKSGDEDDLKTFLINTVVKNNKNRNMPPEKRTGMIFFERDRKRQIFNFWWKSVLSGIKSSVLNAEKKKSQ